MIKKIVYLAVPYSHPDAIVREQRFHLVNKVAADLINKGLHIFSPISHSHPLSIDGNLPKGFDFWVEFDRSYLEVSQKLIVLMVDGWKESKGVQGEIAIATELGIPIEYMEYINEIQHCPDCKATLRVRDDKTLEFIKHAC